MLKIYNIYIHIMVIIINRCLKYQHNKLIKTIFFSLRLRDK